MAVAILCANGYEHYASRVFNTRFGDLCNRCIRNLAAESNAKYDAGCTLNNVPPFVSSGNIAILAMNEVDALIEEAHL